MPKKTTLADAKKSLQICKKAATQAKKDVAGAQKSFIEAPGVESGKHYRAAVASHIQAVKAFGAAQEKVDSLSE